MDADKQEEIIAFVLLSILLAILYTDLCSNSSNVRIACACALYCANFLLITDLAKLTRVIVMY